MWSNFRRIPIEFDGRPRGFTLEDSRSNQPVPEYTCVSTTGKKIMNNWTFWHIEHIWTLYCHGTGSRKTYDLLVIAVLCKVVRCGASQHNPAPKAKPPQFLGCAIPAICSGPWKARPWKVRPWNQESKTTIDCLFCFQEICVFKRNQHLQFCAHFLGNPLTLMNLLVQLILQNSSRQIKTS